MAELGRSEALMEKGVPDAKGVPAGFCKKDGAGFCESRKEQG